MTDTPKLGVTYLEASQAQKHVTVNDAIRTYDALVQPSVKDKDLTAPPGSPANGDAYIVPTGATGAWAGQAKSVAAWYDTAWFFYPPKAGWRFYVADEAADYVYNGTVWAIVATGGGGSLLDTPDDAFSLADNVDPTKRVFFQLSNLTAATTRTYTLPDVSTELVGLAGTQTISGVKTFSGTLSVTAATATIGSATTASTVGLGTGATTTGVTKTVNLGTAGASGSTTVVNIGSATAGALGTTVINSPTVTFANTVTTVGMPQANLTALYAGLGGATADAFNRFSINTPSLLLNNAGASIDMTFNKNAAGNDASLSFKTGFSTRAIAGLTGSDDFTLKVSPNGSTFNDAFTIARATGVITLGKEIVVPASGAPTNPGAGKVTVFGREIAGRIFPAFMGPSGLDSALQPLLARNKVGYWNPPGNAATVPGVFGFTAPTITGFTATARNVATTNLFTRLRRLGFVTAATAAAVGQWRVAVSQYTLGNGAGVGGFSYICRFGISDAALVSGARMFMGMGVGTLTPTNVEPNTLINSIGVGHGAADTTLQLYYGGSVAQTPINLGANFPVNTRNVDMYELALFASPNSTDIKYEVTRLNTGDVATGTLSGTVGTQVPAATTLLAPWGYRTNNASALAVGLDVASCYIETDY